MTGSDVAARRLGAVQNPDGGFGPRPGAPSEPEPTALASIALDDHAARAWLEANQRDDGSFGVVDGYVRDEAATGLAALALDAGPARERALDRLEVLEGAPAEPNDAIPLDVGLHGWPWTRDTFGWVEPTARAMLALRLLRPGSPRVAGGVALLRDRRAAGGGWNYGNREVLGQELPPFAQTTAVAMLALHGLDDDLESEAASVLRRLWREEQAGTISVALSLVVFRMREEQDEARAARAALEPLIEGGDPLGDTVAEAWAVIALGGLVPLREAP